jgi:hypothetical protein
VGLGQRATVRGLTRHRAGSGAHATRGYRPAGFVSNRTLDPRGSRCHSPAKPPPRAAAARDRYSILGTHDPSSPQSELEVQVRSAALEVERHRDVIMRNEPVPLDLPKAGCQPNLYAFQVAGDHIVRIWAVIHPDRLRPWVAS